MTSHAGNVGIVWETPILFSRLVEDCGFIAEQVTPHLLAAPFFRRKYGTIIIPGGFAHPDYSSILSALRACERRINRFITSGGVLLVFGAGTQRPDAYDWLSIRVRYRFGFSEGRVEGDIDSPAGCITQGHSDMVSIDGTFELPDIGVRMVSGASDQNRVDIPIVYLTMAGEPVLIEYRVGAGRVILTTLHEYPSPRFICDLCSSGSETLL
jgi:hypothetical protein